MLCYIFLKNLQTSISMSVELFTQKEELESWV